MSDIPEKHNGFNPNKRGVMSEVAQIDDEILTLLHKRSMLLSRVLGVRKRKGLSAVSPEQEKRLWGIWDRAATRLGLDPKSLRRIYGQLNNLGYNYTDPKGTGKNAPAYWIPQVTRPADVTLPAPANMDETVYIMAMAAALGKPAQIDGAVINDNIADLIKALNQAGAKIDKTPEGLSIAECDDLEMDNKLFFAGNEAFNLFLLMCLSLTTPGTTKFAGGVELKSLDLSLISGVLLQMGARVHNLDPSNPGVPARVESGGEISRKVTPDKDCPVEFLKALAIASLTFEKGIEIDLSANPSWQIGLEGVKNAMAKAGAKVSLNSTAFKCGKGEISFEDKASLDMDDVLGAYLLAIPFFTGGRVELTGAWPQNARAENAISGLKKLINIDINENSVVSSLLPGKKVYQEKVNLGPSPELFPLAMALGAGMAEHGEVSIKADSTSHFEANEFLDRFGLKGRFEDSLIIIEQASPTPTRPWACPNAHYAMAMALVALKAGETGLTNPGELTSLWPQFLSIFNALPIVHQMPAKKEKKHDEPQKRRRIKL